MRFLNAYNKLSHAEVAILLLLVMSTFRICLLPATISATSGESCLYVMLAGMGVDFAVTAGALGVASRGGIGNLDLPPLVKRTLCGLLALFFFLKVAVHTYEAVDYCVNDLFDKAAPLMLMVVFVLTAAILAHKGFAGIARTGIMYLSVIGMLAVLSVFFVAFGGYGYNLWVLLRPRNVGVGLLQSTLWLGNGAVFFLADTRTEVHPTRSFRWGVIAFALVLAGLILFYINFVYSYGSAGQYVKYAFVRLLTNGDPEELGAVDWPVMLIWLLSVPLVLASLFYAGCEGLRQCVARREHGGMAYLVVGVVGVIAAYCLLFADSDGLRRLTQSAALSCTILGVLGLCLSVTIAAVAIGGTRRNKEAT